MSSNAHLKASGLDLGENQKRTLGHVIVLENSMQPWFSACKGHFRDRAIFSGTRMVFPAIDLLNLITHYRM